MTSENATQWGTTIISSGMSDSSDKGAVRHIRFTSPDRVQALGYKGADGAEYRVKRQCSNESCALNTD